MYKRDDDKGRKKSWTADRKFFADKKPKKEKFDFEVMKLAATHEELSVRKKAFIEYFERFQEFPSYLFDNTAKIDPRLAETVHALMNDPSTSPEILKGIEALLHRLPSL
jgi:hypothetical protein